MTYAEFRRRYSWNPSTDVLGRGGYGTVVKATDLEYDTKVAIKISVVDPQEEKYSLLKEYELLCKIPPHAHVAIYDSCHRLMTDEGLRDYAIAEYYPLRSLKNLLKTHSLSLTEKQEIWTGILEGLGHLHQLGIVHRDLKPDNVLIKKAQGKYIARICDFGISKMATSNGQTQLSQSFVGGSLNYASPEQLKGDPIRYNTDIWSFGVMMYELLLGEVPYPMDNASHSKIAQILQQMERQQLPGALYSLSEPYSSTIRKCLIFDGSQRIKTVDEVKQLLRGNSQTGKEDTVRKNKSAAPDGSYNRVSNEREKTIEKENNPKQPEPNVANGKAQTKYTDDIEFYVASDFITLHGKSYKFTDFTAIKYGILVKQRGLNVVDMAGALLEGNRFYTIWLRHKNNEEIKIECCKYMDDDKVAQKRYDERINQLNRTVVAHILSSIYNQLQVKGVAKLNDKITLCKQGILKDNENLNWVDTNFKIENGELTIKHLAEPKTDISSSFRDDWNTVLISDIFDKMCDKAAYNTASRVAIRCFDNKMTLFAIKKELKDRSFSEAQIEEAIDSYNKYRNQDAKETRQAWFGCLGVIAVIILAIWGYNSYTSSEKEEIEASKDTVSVENPISTVATSEHWSLLNSLGSTGVNPRDVATSIQKSIDLDKDFKDKAFDKFIFIGDKYFDKGDTENACICYEVAFKYRPANSEARDRYVRCQK